MSASNPKAVALLVAVFVAGLAAGIALERTWLEGKKKHDWERKPVIERFSEELELTRGQQARIDTILEHFRSRMHDMWSDVRPRYRTIIDSAQGQIEEVLSPEQVARYRELLEKRFDRRDGEEDERNDRGDGNPDPNGEDEGEDG